MTIIKCIDCGREYDSKFEACPNCGCPTEYQSIPSEPKLPQSTPLQNKRQQKENCSKKKKPIFVILPVVFAGIIALGLYYYLGHSYERKMARYAKTAKEFKSTLDQKNQVIAERLDSVVQKVYYIVKATDSYEVFGTPITDIMVHNYATDETKSILADSDQIEDYEFCDIEFKEAKLIEDRLFFIIHSGCMWRCGATGIFYINVRDNTLHYVESCDNAEFDGSKSIFINKMYYLGEQEYGGEKCESKNYSLSTMLSDRAYADNRQEQKKTEERLAEEWRNREIERTIEFDYTVYSDSKFIDHISTLNKPLVYDMVHTNVITIPNNKVWVFERFYTSGYDCFYSPVLGYHKIKNGYCDNPYGPPIKNAQVLYPGQYMFSIKDICSNSNPGHRKATVVFTEKTNSKY